MDQNDRPPSLQLLLQPFIPMISLSLLSQRKQFGRCNLDKYIAGVLCAEQHQLDLDTPSRKRHATKPKVLGQTLTCSYHPCQSLDQSQYDEVYGYISFTRAQYKIYISDQYGLKIRIQQSKLQDHIEPGNQHNLQKSFMSLLSHGQFDLSLAFSIEWLAKGILCVNLSLLQNFFSKPIISGVNLLHCLSRCQAVFRATRK